MVKVDAIEGVVDDVLWLHYDIENDVLYLRLIKDRDAPAYSEETEDGALIVRREDNGEVAGMTIINWWQRYGAGPLPDSIHKIEEAFHPWAQRLPV